MEDADDESADFEESFQDQHQQQQQHQLLQGSDEEDIIFYQEAEQVFFQGYLFFIRPSSLFMCVAFQLF